MTLKFCNIQVRLKISQAVIVLLFICEYSYTPTGKREDLWESHVKRPKVFKCPGAYRSIS